MLSATRDKVLPLKLQQNVLSPLRLQSTAPQNVYLLTSFEKEYKGQWLIEIGYKTLDAASILAWSF